MKKFSKLFLALTLLCSVTACGSKPAEEKKPEGTTAAPAENKEEEKKDLDYSKYTIRIYSNSNSTERTTWLINEAKKQGFNISIDDDTVISGDNAAVQAANENKDGDLIFGLNETRWGQLVNNQYENVKILDWKPSWADTVGAYKYDNKAYGLVIQNILMLYRNDDFGTKGEEIHLDHWADMVDYAKEHGYTWYRQNKVGGTTNSNINNSILYAYVDPNSPAGGISVDGWKKLWEYCQDGWFSADDKLGFDPLNRGDVQISTMYSSALYGKIDAAADGSKNPLVGTMEPENWNLVDIKDGTYYIAEYIGLIDKPGRTEEETEIVKAFADWFGSAEVQVAWSEEFDSYPCNADAVKELYPDGAPAIYQLDNFALKTVEGTDMTYAAYVAAHNAEWTNIMTNLGFYWADSTKAPTTPDWDNLDWSVLTQSK